MPGPTLPLDVVNAALDECGISEIGDIEDGSKEARVATRLYWDTVREILSAAHWNCARKQQALSLLADVSGQLAVQTDVLFPWAYMYEWPTECVHARFIPRTNPYAQQVSNQTVPIFSSPPAATPIGPTWNSPAPFIVGSSNRVNAISSDWYMTEGHDPEQTKVILTNEPNAQLVFTGLMQYPDAWDALLKRAVVAGLSARFAMPLIEDKKLARVIRQDNAQIAMNAINAARVRDGNEGWTIQEHTPDWIRARNSDGSFGGFYCYPWMSVPWLEDAGGVF